MRRRFALTVVFLLLAGMMAVPAAPQIPRPLSANDPIPKGQQIDAKDGDTVLIRGAARVRIVHRSEANLRAIYNSAQRWLVLLADFVDPQKGAPDGFVDSTYSFQELDGAWPLGERWEGSAVVDEYSMAYTPGGSYGISTDGAFVQLFSGSPAANSPWFADSRAIRLSYRGGGRTNAGIPGASRLTFDQAEERGIADATRNAQRGNGSTMTTFDGPGGTTLTSGVTMGVRPSPTAATGRAGDAPVRVGSAIVQPQKIFDVKPQLPPVAAQAGVRGTVILEIVIGTDGSVTSAKVLRSIPLLDQAALDAVKQWRYAPTQHNGQPIPVIMTVTVAFP